jgi:glycine hydroxymethyltransferase
MLVDLRPFNVTGKELEKRLDEVHITVNKNAIPNDPQSPFITSGIRVGTPAVTSRGFGADEMLKIAKWIKDITVDFESNKERVCREVLELCEKFPIYED